MRALLLHVVSSENHSVYGIVTPTCRIRLAFTTKYSNIVLRLKDLEAAFAT